jgi:NAD(P)-dependent dehydrogenase (short-subunit alcohol dehydrogenase family)
MTTALTGKVAIVTGASRGIGRQIAEALACRGATVVLAARTVEPRRRLPGTIGETLKAIQDAGGTALAVPCDVAMSADIERLVATAAGTFGRLDVLVNNAADTTASAGPVDGYPLDGWRHQYETNVHAPFMLIGLALPHMRAQGGGIIVNITSGAADMVDLKLSARPGGRPAAGLGSMVGYASTKAALNRLSNALAPELAADNIAITCVDPGFTRTELVEILGQRGLVDLGAAHPMEVPVAAVLDVITSDDPLTRSGHVIRA